MGAVLWLPVVGLSLSSPLSSCVFSDGLVDPSACQDPNCNYESNAILSCYPEGNTTVVESEYSKFIWNVNYPEFFNNGYVDIYLFNANTEEMALEFPGIANARGSIGWAPGEAWWPTEDHWVLGQNVSIPYYFVIVPANTTLTGAEQHQATFTAIQTAPPSSLLSSVLSVSSASVASSRSSVAGLNPSTTPTGGLQDDSHDSGFPDWGIALVVILGFLALLGFALALYFCIKTIRKSKRYRGSEGSIGSGTPIVPQAEKEKAEGAGLLSRGLGLGGSNRNSGHDDEEKHLGIPPSVIGAASDRGRKMSSASRKSSRAIIEGPASEEDGPITGNEAAAMADAFRKALRQPLFSNDPSPGSTNSNPNSNEPRASMQLEHSNPSIPQSDSSPILAAGKQAGRDAEDGDGGPGRAPEEEEEGSEEARELIERELAGEGRSLSNHKERKMVGVHGTS
ncbi:hypothetical protein BT69DRAFT_618249 [Atractiella rhizophila]|nr:hypothetical protein BT69DRAFT_618249 [Atractiella rhizophila]